MRHSHQLAIAASAGAVVGFALVILVLTDNALTWAPLLVVPSIATDWKARCAVEANKAELHQFLRDFGFCPATATHTDRAVVAFRRRLDHRPHLTRAQLRRIDAWLEAA